MNVHHCQRANNSCRKESIHKIFCYQLKVESWQEKTLFPCMQEAGDNPLKNMAILYKLSTTSVQCTRLGGNMATYTKTLNVNCFY